MLQAQEVTTHHDSLLVRNFYFQTIPCGYFQYVSLSSLLMHAFPELVMFSMWPPFFHRTTLLVPWLLLPVSLSFFSWSFRNQLFCFVLPNKSKLSPQTHMSKDLHFSINLSKDDNFFNSSDSMSNSLQMQVHGVFQKKRRPMSFSLNLYSLRKTRSTDFIQ